jgi:hypothetical protein
MLAALTTHGPVAQLDRALRFERRGWEFKSLRVHHFQAVSNPHFKSDLVRLDPAHAPAHPDSQWDSVRAPAHCQGQPAVHQRAETRDREIGANQMAWLFDAGFLFGAAETSTWFS